LNIFVYHIVKFVFEHDCGDLSDFSVHFRSR
jgi:hypothetical protein